MGFARGSTILRRYACASRRGSMICSISPSACMQGSTWARLALGSRLLADRSDELAILQLDAVHGDVQPGEVDLVLLAVVEVIVTRIVGPVVADVAEERAERAVIVETGTA